MYVCMYMHLIYTYMYVCSYCVKVLDDRWCVAQCLNRSVSHVYTCMASVYLLLLVIYVLILPSAQTTCNDDVIILWYRHSFVGM